MEWSGWITALVMGMVGAIVALRKGFAESAKITSETHVKVSADEAKARQKLKHDEESWAVKQARDLYREMKDRVDSLWESERKCHLRLATSETRLASAVIRIRDLEHRLGIESGGDDSWTDEALSGGDDDSRPDR